jgi:hypothetical protein
MGPLGGRGENQRGLGTGPGLGMQANGSGSQSGRRQKGAAGLCGHFEVISFEV